MKKTKLILIFIVYLLIVATLYFTSFTISKYLTREITTSKYRLENSLYFNYERGQLYLNDVLTPYQALDNPDFLTEHNPLISSKYLEFENVSPSDVLRYNFFISNINENGDFYNGLDAQFAVSAVGLLRLPALGESHDVECSLAYRKILGQEGSLSHIFSDLYQGQRLELPKYLDFETKYELQIIVLVDDQIQFTSDDDYVDATLTINLFINAVEVGA